MVESQTEGLTFAEIVKYKPYFFVDRKNIYERIQTLKGLGVVMKELSKKDKNVFSDQVELKMSDNPWKASHMFENEKDDSQTITSILNKLTNNNIDKFISEVLLLNYADPKIVDIIFTKSVKEPAFGEIYAKFCSKLPNIHVIINNMCVEQFNTKKHKNMCTFIASLYRLNIIGVANINRFIDILFDDLTDSNLDILCTLLISADPKDKNFKGALKKLEEAKQQFIIDKKFRSEAMVNNVLKKNLNSFQSFKFL